VVAQIGLINAEGRPRRTPSVSWSLPRSVRQGIAGGVGYAGIRQLRLRPIIMTSAGIYPRVMPLAFAEARAPYALHHRLDVLGGMLAATLLAIFISRGPVLYVTITLIVIR